MDVRTKLSERRKELGLTLADVAAKVGVSEATVSRWESGHIDNMKRDKIALLAKALQVSPLFVMGMEDELLENPEQDERPKGGLFMPLKDNIKKLRTKLGMTLEELAQQIGVSRQTIQRYESGVISNIPSDNIEKLAIALKTTPANLMDWDNSEKQGYYLDSKTAQIAQEIFENKDLGLLFDASRKLQPDELLSVKNLVETMVRKERGEND